MTNITGLPSSYQNEFSLIILEFLPVGGIWILKKDNHINYKINKSNDII